MTQNVWRQSIAKVRPGVPIVCEIDNGANVSFLCGEETTVDEEQSVDKSFTNTGPFAAGAVYVDSLQDKLSVQAFYNPNLLRIIRELLVGQAEEGDGHVRDAFSGRIMCSRSG